MKFVVPILLLVAIPWAATFSTTTPEIISEIKKMLEEGVELDIQREVLNADTTLLKKAAELSEQHGFVEGYIRSHRHIGDFYLRKGEGIEAMGHFHLALKKTKGMEMLWEDDFFLTQRIANAHYMAGRINEAGAIYRRLNKILDGKIRKTPKENHLYVKKIDVLNNWANSYLQRGQFDTALDYLLEAEKLIQAEFFKDSLQYMDKQQKMAFSISGAYLFKGDGKAAKPYIQKYIVYLESENILNYRALAQTYGNLAYCDFLLKNFKESYNSYNKSIKISQENNYPDVTMVTYKDLSDTYLAEGKYREGISYLNKHYILKDSLQGVQVQRNLNELTTKYETEKKEQEIIRLTQQNKIQRQSAIISYVGWGVFVLFGLMLFLYYKNLTKRRKQKGMLQKLKLENANKELELKQKELEHKKQDITRLALEISNKQELAEQLLSQLAKLERQVPTKSQGDWHRLRHQISNQLTSNEDQKILLQNVEEINHAFFNKLAVNYPKLTKSDRELCSFIKLGFSNKEIAVLRNVSQEAVRTSQYRLRKKLELSSQNEVEILMQGL